MRQLAQHLELVFAVSALVMGASGYLLHVPTLDFLGLLFGGVALGMLLGRDSVGRPPSSSRLADHRTGLDRALAESRRQA